MPAKLFIIEGADGAGKSTIVEGVLQRLISANISIKALSFQVKTQELSEPTFIIFTIIMKSVMASRPLIQRVFSYYTSPRILMPSIPRSSHY